MKYLPVILFFLSAFTTKTFSQVNHHGIVKLTTLQSSKAINGIWNSADHTGNAKLDKAFDNYAASKKLFVKAIRALESTAAQIRTDPQKFINPDGSVNMQTIQELINQKFAVITEVTVPSFTIQADSTTSLR